MNIQTNIDLSQHTTLKVGGLADYFVVVRREAELHDPLLFAEEKELPILLLGGGSNILVGDNGYRGLVIKNELQGEEITEEDGDVLLTLGAGEMLDDIIERSVLRGEWGLENLSAIPGTIGATPVQNVGAYGVEVSSLIVNVTAINKKTKNKKTFTNTECKFAYRDSFFKTPEGKDWIIINVTYSLTKKYSPVLEYGELQKIKNNTELTPALVRATVQEIREHKFPDWKQTGTAGSFFKNPVITVSEYEELQAKYPDIPGYIQPDGQIKISLGWVLDHVCGLKGYCENGICLYEKQALVLINQNNTSGDAVKLFSDSIIKKIKQKTNINVEPEVRFY